MLTSGLFDALDGAIARTYGEVTKFGGFFDSLLDRYADAVVLCGIMLGGLTELYWGLAALIGSLLVSYSRARAEAAGIKMAVGTDAIYEFMNENPILYFEEVERFVKNGYTPHEALVAATRIGAEVLDVSDRLGTIEKGKIADLLVIDEDPLDDIRNLRKVSVIIQGGKVIRKGALK